MNYMLYGQTKKPQMYSGPLDDKQWHDLVENLKNTPKAIEEVNKANVENLTAAGDEITQAYNKIPPADDKNANNITEAKRGLDELASAVQVTNNIWTSKTLNTLAKNFYSQNYTLYRSIINGYQQQKNSGTSNQKQNGDQTKAAENPGEELAETNKKQ